MVEFERENDRLSELEARVAKLEDFTSPTGPIFMKMVEEFGEAFHSRAQIKKDLDELRENTESWLRRMRPYTEGASEIKETLNKQADEMDERINNLVTAVIALLK